MTDDIAAYGLGALLDAPDERDYPLSALYASEGLTASVVLPRSHAAPGMPPVLDQHATPMCVAYSSSAMKAWQDRWDQERFFDFDEPTFFGQIGGTLAGAYVRNAMEQMRLFGYPVAGSEDASNHRIAAYYAVPRDLATIKAAILARASHRCVTTGPAAPTSRTWAGGAGRAGGATPTIRVPRVFARGRDRGTRMSCDAARLCRSLERVQEGPRRASAGLSSGSARALRK